jgi:predicted ATPase with chaperone activity
MKLQDIRGNEHVKRAIEVALVGDLSVTFVGNRELAILFANSVLVEKGYLNVHYQKLCLCGNFGSPQMCICTNEEINSLRKSDIYRENMSAHIVIQVVEQRFEQIIAKRLPKSDEAILERATKARSNYTNYSIHDLDETCSRLLGMFYEQNYINQIVVDRIMEVASAIAALDVRKGIQPAHLAEALQYSGLKYLEYLS